jgi:hypothetical protein
LLESAAFGLHLPFSPCRSGAPEPGAARLIAAHKEEQPMSIPSTTHDELSPDARLSANLKIAIGHIEAAAWAMQSITTYNDPAEGITDADWLWQIAELLGELDPETRSAHCPECGGSQLTFTELVYIHHNMTDANATHWQFGGDADIREINAWRVQCSSCKHVLRTADEPNGYEGITVICDGVAM